MARDHEILESNPGASARVYPGIIAFYIIASRIFFLHDSVSFIGTESLSAEISSCFNCAYQSPAQLI